MDVVLAVGYHVNSKRGIAFRTPNGNPRLFNCRVGSLRDHPFADGCKRIAATLFINFLYKNNRLYRNNKQIISNEALVAITILTAESKPEEMEIIVKLIMNHLV